MSKRKLRKRTSLPSSIRKIFGEICTVEIADDVKFELVDISDIREGDDYPGIRAQLKSNYPPIIVPLTVDVTTGDVITPREIEYTFSLLFDNRTISILAYNLETVLAEKIETVLSRGIANTRPRDFYDIHILYALRGAECNAKTLLQANSSGDSGKSISVILTMQRIFSLTMPAVLFSVLWTVSRSKQKSTVWIWA